MGSPSVVVTGASTGIGRACALLLNEHGFRVFAGVRRVEDGESLRAAASERLEPILLDVTNAAAIESAAKTVAGAVGGAGLQGLVNNAGIAVGGILEFQDIDAFRWQLEVNVIAVAAVTRAFLPAIRQGRGRIVHMSSNSGYLAAPFVGPYSASKFALEGYTDSLRRELRPWRIHVAAVQPGCIATPIWDKGRAATGQIRDALPPSGHELYGDVFDRMKEYVEKSSKRGIPPERVARAVHHALTAKRPRTRYRVGIDATLTRLITWLLPDRAADGVVARLAGLS